MLSMMRMISSGSWRIMDGCHSESKIASVACREIVQLTPSCFRWELDIRTLRLEGDGPALVQIRDLQLVSRTSAAKLQEAKRVRARLLM